MLAMGYTSHAVERFVERFPERLEAGVAPKVCLHRAFQGASLERGFMNDTRRIVWMLEKYGDFNYDYYIKDKMVFVTREGALITVMHRDDVGMQKLFGPKSQPRFRKKTCPA
jgi:hypothetical protein